MPEAGGGLQRPTRPRPGPGRCLEPGGGQCPSGAGVLQELGLESFAKTTGGKGLHLVVPIVRHHDWDEVKVF